MDISFKNTEDTLTPKLQVRVEDRLKKLAKLLPEKGTLARAEFELRRNSSANHSERKWEAVLNVDSAGDRFNSSAKADVEELAADKSIEEMRDVLIKKNNKERSVSRREGKFWKIFSRRNG